MTQINRKNSIKVALLASLLSIIKSDEWPTTYRSHRKLWTQDKWVPDTSRSYVWSESRSNSRIRWTTEMWGSESNWWAPDMCCIWCNLKSTQSYPSSLHTWVDSSDTSTLIPTFSGLRANGRTSPSKRCSLAGRCGDPSLKDDSKSWSSNQYLKPCFGWGHQKWPKSSNLDHKSVGVSPKVT